MSGVREQKRRIEDLRSAKYITGALRDISAIELKGVRERFERNASFANELRTLYELVWRIADRAGKVPALGSKKSDTLYVAYTTNRHFYGVLNHDVMKKFFSSTDTDDRCMVIGETGKQIWLSNAKKRKEISFMSFKNDTPDAEEVAEFLKRTTGFSRVFVFYPGFVSVFAQDPQMIDITFRPTDQKGDKDQEKMGEQELQYFLEPDLAEMIMFFNTQVRYLLFERMLLETELSRVAARLVKMDAADQNADDLIRNERKELKKAYTSFSSRRMIETLVGYLQWHTQKM